MPVVEIIRIASCGSILIAPYGSPACRFGNTGSAAGMGVGLEVHLAPAPVGDMGVQLGGGEIRVPQHLLDAA